MHQLPLYAVIKASLAVLGIGLAVVFVVTAWRPADDRDEFIRKLPPPSEPLAVRAAHLRMQLAQVVKKLVMVYTVIAGVLLVAGVLASSLPSSAASICLLATAARTAAYATMHSGMRAVTSRPRRPSMTPALSTCQHSGGRAGASTSAHGEVFEAAGKPLCQVRPRTTPTYHNPG